MKKIPMMKILSISVLTLILLLLMSGTVNADGSQSWYLTRNGAGIQADDGTFHSCDNLMCKEEPNTNKTSMELIGAIGSFSSTAWWYSDEAAQSDVTFGENSWRVELFYINTFGSGSLQAQVWSVNDSGHLERLLAEGEVGINKHTGYTELYMECPDYESTDQTVLKDHRLALRVSYDPDQWADGVILFYGSKEAPANLQSPETDPGFPLPELPAVILLGGGLLGLGGYILFRWRKSVTQV